DNYLGFLVSGFTVNPHDDVVVKITGGAGFHHHKMNAEINNNITVEYSDGFSTPPDTEYSLSDLPQNMRSEDTSIYAQGRLDFDWSLGRGFIFSAGGEELYSRWLYDERGLFLIEERADPSVIPSIPLELYYVNFTSDVKNHGFESSLYSLLEYQSENQRFGAEIGVRADHLYFMGRGFTLQTMPVVNPRINLDFTPLRNKGIVEGLTLTLGTGLFSSMNRVMRFIEEKYDIDDFEYKPARSWTSVAGIKMDFSGGFSLTIEGYYKYIYNRTYVFAGTDPLTHDITTHAGFDGEGRVWGFDLMLQKFSSRYWDGWISYSFNVARYRDPEGVESGLSVNGGELNGSSWYYPEFHRFHNLNLVVNYKPTRIFRITTRLGFASGVPERTSGEVLSYPVQIDVPGDPNNGKVIEKWQRASEYSDTARGGFTLPLDLKFSFLGFNRKGRVQSEVYIAVENALVMVLPKSGASSFNSYTGREEEGNSGSQDVLPIPMISLGFKWSF
ncbi:MAG: hypothetical protein LBH73_08520, partial [Spirochaetaceae bacterium]|nr:hypothetical protein [Spirochaetaceae bacterium]